MFFWCEFLCCLRPFCHVLSHLHIPTEERTILRCLLALCVCIGIIHKLSLLKKVTLIKKWVLHPPVINYSINYVQYCCFFLVLQSTKIHEKRFRHPCLLSLMMSRCTKSMQKIASLYSRYNGTYLHCINCIKDVSCFGYSLTDDTGERVHSDTS